MNHVNRISPVYTAGLGFRDAMSSVQPSSSTKPSWGELFSAVARSNIAKEVGEAFVQHTQRSFRRMAFETVPSSQLGLAVLASRLTDLPYERRGAREIAQGLETLLTRPELLHFQQQDRNATTAQWTSPRRASTRHRRRRAAARAAVFRGNSMNDVCNDLMAMPTRRAAHFPPRLPASRA